MKNKLVKELEKANVRVDDWYEDYQLSQINTAMGNIQKLSLSLVGEDNGILVVYYSKKLGKCVILDWDSYQECEDIAELADYLIEYQLDAETLEKHITVK